MLYHFITLLTLASTSLALAEPLITPAPALKQRQTSVASDPALVGYISGTAGYGDVRSCDYPATLSTSGSFVQCCAPTGSCPFYTACSSNTLLASGTSVPCDTDPSLSCKTGIVVPSVGATSGPRYLACWQTSLANQFTFVQNVGTAATSDAISSSAVSSSAVTTVRTTSTGSSGTMTRATTITGSSSTSTSATTTSGNNAGRNNVAQAQSIVGALALLFPFLV